MHRNTVLTAFLTSLILGLPAIADERSSVVAVFNIESRGVELSAEVTESLSDYLSGRLAEGGRYLVIPREQIKQSLTRQKTESHKECYAQSCQIELGMELAANKTLAAQVFKLGSQCRVNLSMYDLARAATENSATASGDCTTDGIVASLDSAVVRILAMVDMTGRNGTPVTNAGVVLPPPPEVVTSGPTISGGAVTASTGDLTIQGKTRAGTPVRLEVTDPNGQTVVSGSPFKAPQAAIGLWTVVAQATGHEGVKRTISVPADDAVLEKIELIPFGGLRVIGDPAGAMVTISGPDGFSNFGGLPWEGQGLRNGKYGVTVNRDGYQQFSETTTISDGETAVVEVHLTRIQTKIAHMQIGGMGMAGFCSKTSIEETVKQHAGDMRNCYDAELQRDGTLTGKVAIRWTINLEGRVENAFITSSTLNNPAAESCIVDVIRRIIFVRPEGGICVVQYPFRFFPK